MAYYGYPPGYYYGDLSPPGGRHRSHSQGRVEQNVYIPPQNVFVAPPEQPRGRAVDHLADEVHHLALATEGRSRSRGRHHRRSASPTLSELEAELKALKKEGQKTAEEKRREEMISKWQNEQAEKKRKEEEKFKEIKEKIKMQEILDKEKKEAEWKAYELERERRIAEEKAKKKKEEEKIEENTRATLRNAGMSENQIDRVIAMSKKDKENSSTTTTSTTVAMVNSHSGHGHHHHHAGDIIIAGGSKPTYTRAKRSDIAPEVLDRYGIGWRADDRDPIKYILVQATDENLLEVLHEETKERKKGHHGHKKGNILMIEEKKKHKEPGLAIVRKRRSKSRSRSRARSGERIIIVNR